MKYKSAGPECLIQHNAGLSPHYLDMACKLYPMTKASYYILHNMVEA